MQGLLAVDDAQLDYLLALTGAHRQQLHSNSSQHQQHNAASSSSSTSTGTGTAPLPAPPVDMPESAVLMSLMSQVTEVLPDYGEGFLTACLHHYNWNAEQVCSRQYSAVIGNCMVVNYKTYNHNHTIQRPPYYTGADNCVWA